MNAKLLTVLMGLVLSQAAQAATVAQQARQLIATGDAGIALLQLDTYLAGNPKDSEARFARGLALSKLQRTNEAIRAFADLIRDQPQFPEPYNNLGVLLAGAGDYSKARQAFELAIAKNPQYIAAQRNLADVNVALATQGYQKILSKDPGNTEAQLKLLLLKNVQSTSSARAPTPAAAAVTDDSPVLALLPQNPIRTQPVETDPVQAPTPVSPDGVKPAPEALAVLAQTNVASVTRLPATGSPAIAVTPNASSAGAQSPTPPADLSTKVDVAAPALTPAPASPVAAAPAVAVALAAPARPASDSPIAAEPSAKPEDTQRAVATMVQAWADAWSQRNADRVLSFYSKDFTPPDGTSRERWLEQRRKEVSEPKRVKLRLDKVRLTMVNPETAQVSFRQLVETDRSSHESDQTLVLQQSEGSWMIVVEEGS